MQWLTLRGSTVVPVGLPVDGALPPVPDGGADGFLGRMLAEPTVAELLAWSWWSAAVEE